MSIWLTYKRLERAGIVGFCSSMAVLAALSHYADDKGSGFWTEPQTASDFFASAHVVIWGMLALYNVAKCFQRHKKRPVLPLHATLLPSSKELTDKNRLLQSKVHKLEGKLEVITIEKNALGTRVAELMSIVSEAKLGQRLADERIVHEKALAEQRVAHQKQLFVVAGNR